MEPTQAYLDFIRQVSEAQAALVDMSELYNGLSEEERKIVDEGYPQNLKSMDEQASNLYDYCEHLTNSFPGLKGNYFQKVE